MRRAKVESCYVENMGPLPQNSDVFNSDVQKLSNQDSRIRQNTQLQKQKRATL